MNASATEDFDVKKEIEKTLGSIHKTTLNIKRELERINSIVHENGELDIAVAKANVTLLETIERSGVNLVELMKDKENFQETDILTAPATEAIMKKLATVPCRAFSK